MNFTIDEIAQMLGAKDLLIAQQNKLIILEQEKSEDRLRQIAKQNEEIIHLNARLSELTKG